MDALQQRQQGGPERVADAISALRSVQASCLGNLQNNVDTALRTVNGRIQQCRDNLDRRQLRLRYGRTTNRVSMSSGRFGAVIPGDSVAEQVITMGVGNFLNLYNAALIGRLILTWFPNPPEAIVGPLATVCDPYLNLFRGIIPPIGGTIDLSPILAFITLDLFTNAFAALPCELGPDGKTPLQKQRQFRMFNPTKAMLAWHKRAEATRQRKQRPAE